MTYWSGYDTRPIGGGNPYYCCVGCGRSDPEINGDIEKHGEGCSEVAKMKAAVAITDLRARCADHEAEIARLTAELDDTAARLKQLLTDHSQLFSAAERSEAKVARLRGGAERHLPQRGQMELIADQQPHPRRHRSL